MQPVRFELSEIIEDSLKTVEPMAESRRLALLERHEPGLPELHTDKEKLRQIVINLLSNAVKFTEEGSVTVATRPEAGHIVIGVIDTGIGIPEDAQEHIFEEFSQVDDSSTRSVGGTGLGLAITCHLVGLLGGEIKVESTLGSIRRAGARRRREGRGRCSGRPGRRTRSWGKAIMSRGPSPQADGSGHTGRAAMVGWL